MEQIDLTALLEKINGDELSAQEFVTLVQAVKDNQEILKNPKVGWVSKYKEGSATILYFFETKKDADDYEAGLSTTFITSIPLPDSGGGGTASYVIRLRTLSDSIIESSTRDVSLKLLATSLLFNPITGEAEDTGEDVTLQIQRRIGTDNWINVGSIPNFNTVLNKESFTENDYTSVSLKDFLVNGNQSIRIVARGNTSDVASTYALFTITIAEMGLEYATDWQNAYIYDSLVASTNNMQIGYRIRGAVNKELNWELYDPFGTKINYGKQEIGTSEYSESKYYLTVEHPQGVGIYVIKSWLNYANSLIQTNPITLNIMLSTKGDTTTLVVVNDIVNPVINWTSQRMFNYAVYNPTSPTGFSDVSLQLTNYEGTVNWITSNVPNVTNGQLYDYTQYLSIEYYNEDGDKVKLFSASMNIYVENVLLKTLIFSVDNTNDFAPTAGADFVMLPSMRSNTDLDREYIHNETSLSTEEKTLLATWENVVFEQDGWIIEDDVKRLRLFSGSKVTIPYESYTDYTQVRGLTIELDFSINNATDESEPVIVLGKENSLGNFIGLKLFAKKGFIYTNEHTDEFLQDFEWQDNTRTHLAVNIMPALDITNVGTLNVVRIFINGCIDREFKFDTTDSFWSGGNSGGIQIGSNTADVDIFSIRIFKDKQLSSTQILNDYIASLSDVETKLQLIESNNIMENGVISYEKVKDKYNTLVWTGIYPSYHRQAPTKGDLKISIIGDPRHSGTINNMGCKGQGTSSMKYYYWNGTFSFNDDSVWIDADGNERGAYYKLRDDSPNATKLVGKINWASSMQSHKMGHTRAYQDLYNEVFNNNTGWEPNGITTLEGYENTRIAVEEEVFLFFIQETPESIPRFFGPMTWGSGKGDKLTFGYDKNHPVLKDYLMIEGTDQNPKLTLCQVPWFEDEVIYNEEEEYYQYNGEGSFDVALGNLDSIHYFIKAHNLCFAYSTRIKYWNGNISSLQKSEAADKSYQYFLVGQSYNNFNLYRYDWLTNKWVNAGTTKDENTEDGYAVVNLNTQLNLNVSTLEGDFNLVETTFKNARIAKFRELAPNYFHINDMLYTMQYNKFNAASDNRAKNTYLYYDPVDKIIRNAGDDLDTTGKNNNQGQKQKPYWVEEHDYDDRPLFNRYYWAGENNAMYNLFEDAYSVELRTMMRRIMGAMETLGGTIMDFWETYYFSIQRYLPATVYNETAKLWYETARIAMDAGTYNNDTDPLSQSLGSQLQSELEWYKQRIVYMGSYCEYDNALGPDIEYRQLNSSVYKEVPYPVMYLYRKFGESFVYPINPETGLLANRPLRFRSGDTAVFNVVGGTDGQCTTKGASYLTDIGDLSTAHVTGAVSFASGKRLTRLKLGDENGSLFNVSSITAFPPNVSEINLTNCGTQLGNIANMESLSKLQIFKALGTGINSAFFPQSNNIHTIWLPNTVHTLSLKNQMNLNDFVFDKQSLQRLTMGNVNIDIQQFVEDWIVDLEDNEDVLRDYTITLDNIEWKNFSGANLSKLAHFGSTYLKGTIYIDDFSLTPEQKQAAMDAFGEIDNPTNDLHVVYANKLTATLNPPYIVGGLESSTLVVSSLNTDVDISITTGNDIVSLVKQTEYIQNNALYIEYAVSASETPINITVEFTITDGTIVLNRDFVVRRQSHITDVILSKNQYNITEEPLYANSVQAYPVFANVSPQDMTDTYVLSWGLRAKDASYISNIITQGGIEYSQIIDVNTNEVYAIIPTMGSMLSDLQGKNEVTVLIIAEGAKKNDPIFEVTATAIVNGVEVATGGLSVVNHAFYKEYAIQTFDPEAANYNPFVGIKMYEAGLGGAWEVKENPDGSKGVALSYEEAAIQGDTLNLQIFCDISSVVDTNGNCAESYSNGEIIPKTYYVDNFNELQYFTNIKSITAPYKTAYNGIRFKQIIVPEKAVFYKFCLDQSVPMKIILKNPQSINNASLHFPMRWNGTGTQLHYHSIYVPYISDDISLSTDDAGTVRGSFFNNATSCKLYIYEDSFDNIIDTLTLTTTNSNIWKIPIANISNVIVPETYISNSQKLNFIEPVKVYYQGTLAQWSKIKFNGTQSSPAAVSGNLYIDNVKVQGSVTTTPDEDGNQWAAFEGLPITSVTIGAGTTVLKPYAFNNCKNLSSVDLTEGITEISSYCFMNCSSLYELELPNSLITAGNQIREFSNVRILNFKDNVISIGSIDYTRGNPWKYTIITHLTIGKNVKRFTQPLFSEGTGCTSIKQITFNATSFVDGLFRNKTEHSTSAATNFTLILGEGVTNFPIIPFTTTTYIYSYSITPPPILDDVFVHIATGSNKTLYIPAGTEDAYMAVEGWAYLVNTKGFTISATL